MNRNLIWIYVLVIQHCYVCARPAEKAANTQNIGEALPYTPTSDNVSNENEKVISVRITSSVAVARGNGKLTQRADTELKNENSRKITTETTVEHNESNDDVTDLPPSLRGANIEFLKQLNAKKESKPIAQEHGDHFKSSTLRYDDDESISYETKNDQANTNEEGIQRAQRVLSSDDFKDFRSKSISILDEALKLADDRLNVNNTNEKVTEPATENAYLSTLYDESEFNGDDKDNYSQSEYIKEMKEIDDSIAESSVKSVLKLSNKHSEDYENIDNVPLARSVAHSPSSKNYIQGSNNKPPSERESSTRLTTVSFNIVHDAPKMPSFNDPGKPYVSPSQSFQEQHKFYDSPIIYSRPAQIYSEPAKIYSEPAKIYSEPAKIYSEPAKIYSEPAKIYSVPAKFYSEPASLHLKPSAPSRYPEWQTPAPSISPTHNTNLASSTTIPDLKTPPHQQQPERNFEVDEKVSVLTDGQTHGEQETSTEKCKQENCKVGYVVKGRQFNKYRVEERTSDGFIVGEYGVVRNEDGALRGVRYTADSEASPRLIYDALMKFLQLK